MGLRPLIKGSFIAVAIFLSLYVCKKLNLDNYFSANDELKRVLQDSIPKNDSMLDFNFIFVAHAGGGLNNRVYLNSLEAIDNSYHLGVNFIEIDFEYTSDSVMVLSHDYVKQEASEFLADKKYGTHLTLGDLMEWLANKNIFIITDIKVDNLATLQSIAKDYPQLISKIIPQAYSFSEIGPIKRMGFRKVIFTNYKSRYPIMTIMKLAKAEIVFGITVPYGVNFKLMGYTSDLRDSPTPFFTHTVNDINEIMTIEKVGCRGVYTDFALLKSHKSFF